jgi:hypothetical protein
MTRVPHAARASGERRPPNDPEQLPDESELDETTGGAVGDEGDQSDTADRPDEEPDGAPDPGLAEQ